MQSFIWVQAGHQIIWRACSHIAPPLCCTSYREVGGMWNRKEQSSPSSPALAAPLSCCHSSPYFSLQLNPCRTSAMFFLKSPGTHRLTWGFYHMALGTYSSDLTAIWGECCGSKVTSLVWKRAMKASGQRRTTESWGTCTPSRSLAQMMNEDCLAATWVCAEEHDLSRKDQDRVISHVQTAVTHLQHRWFSLEQDDIGLLPPTPVAPTQLTTFHHLPEMPYWTPLQTVRTSSQPGNSLESPNLHSQQH